MTKVFISYSRKDVSFVEELVADLKNVGLDVWYDVSSLRGGSRWRIEIEAAIRNSQFVIVVLSPDSIASEWVEREFLFASNLERKIIPLMYCPCELPLNYLDLNYIDVQGGKYRQGFTDLLKALAVEPGIMPLPDTEIKINSFVSKNKYAIAVVVLLVLIFAALLNSSFPRNRTEPTPTPTATNLLTPTEPASTTPESPTATEYVSPTPIVLVVTSTEVTPTASPTASATSTPTPTDTATSTPSSTPTPKGSTMTAILQSTDDDGKTPLMINFDARTSYIKFADGSMIPCGNNPFCSYSFAIYRDSKFVDRISNNTGILSYTFGAKGKYFVTVYVCRGEACNDDGVTVTVR
ncbi:MAG: TIR domain-containing protein [Chloroflexi bacterium]|nr:TIR domain-containing protein [Chloroflexota bacterium]